MIISAIHAMLSNDRILKVGFGLRQQLMKLAPRHQLNAMFRDCKSMLDIRLLWQKRNNTETDDTLSSITARAFGKPLDESPAFSNWTRRPLKRDQIHYLGMCSISMLKFLEVRSRCMFGVGCGHNVHMLNFAMQFCLPSVFDNSIAMTGSASSKDGTKLIQSLKYTFESESAISLPTLREESGRAKERPVLKSKGLQLNPRTSPRGSGSSPSVDPDVAKRLNERRYRGKVKFFSRIGYGYIYVDNPEEGVPPEVFFFRKNISVPPGRRPTLNVGDVVEFTLGINQKGNLGALDITAPGGGYVTRKRRVRKMTGTIINHNLLSACLTRDLTSFGFGFRASRRLATSTPTSGVVQ